MEGASSGSQQDSTASQGDGATAGEPGFGEGAAGADSLPDMTDEPSLEDALGSMEQAMGEAGQGQGASAGSPSGGTQSGSQSGSQSGGSGSAGGQQAGGGYGNLPQGSGGTGGASGPLTPAEQVAILDAQLEKGTGEFDAMILEEQAQQRSAARQNAPAPSSSSGEPAGSSGGGYGSGSPSEGGTANSGGYGGGMGGATQGGGSMPKDSAKYPPPADIPSGNDDDVVARQLREAAMREADPAVREKLWDEYRKYKGISQ
jgi:hypothetical protein